MLTLSHWPRTATPRGLARDLSAEIAFAALDRGARWRGARAVSNDHFDTDGLAGLFALADPEARPPTAAPV